MTPISVCCLSYNSERTLAKTLESVRTIADDLVVIDSYSTDASLEIARQRRARTFQNPYKYHGLQMNYAIAQAAHDWVFCIDSDEYLDQRMIASLQECKAKGLQGRQAFRLHRQWWFLGKPLHAFYPVTSPDRIVRFFDRRIARFNDSPVHDKPVGFNRCDWLEGLLIHETTGSIHELFDKMNRYTTRYVEGYGPTAPPMPLYRMFVGPISAFFKWYFFKKNCLDGFPGFILANYAAFYTFLKYVKLYQFQGRRSPTIDNAASANQLR